MIPKNYITNKLTLYKAVDFCAPIFKYSVTSVHRTVKRNAGVGGSKTSQHQVGAAWDLVLDDMSDANRERLVRVFERLGAWVLDEGDHVHVQLKREYLDAGDWV